MVKQLESFKRERFRNGCTMSPTVVRSKLQQRNTDTYEVVAIHISPDLGERIMLSSDRLLLEELFPEIMHSVFEGRSGAAWNQFDGRQVIRFPLNGYCKLNSIQVITRFLNAGFTVQASTSGGVESQQFSEFLLVRKSGMWYNNESIIKM